MMAVAGVPWQLEFENVEQRCGYLLTSGLWSDCTFMVGSETSKEVVPVHKLVLAMASPVFEAMFCGGLSERNELIVSIPDVEPEAFKALLQYIYTGNINIGSFDMACNLLYGAEKYMLPHLSKHCNRYICAVLGPGNACQAYELARLFDKRTLLDKCIQIISTNTKEVLNDSSFEDVQLNTLITVCSLDQLNVDSELDLFNAVARYAEAEQRRQEQISAPKVLPSVESSFRRSPPAELDTNPPTEVTPFQPQLRKESTIHTALQKIRFLSLSAAQFAAGPTRSGLLTEEESHAVLKNILSADSPVPIPTGFTESRERRRPCKDSLYEGSTAKPRPKPSTEPLDVAATKLTTPAEIVRGLLSSERETLEDAARAARRMTCADVDADCTSCLTLLEAGGIPALVAALLHPWTGVQYDAAWAITNIACVGAETSLPTRNRLQDEIVEGAIPLVGLLESGAGAVAEQAAWALGNIAVHSGARRDRVWPSQGSAILNAGAPSALLPHLQPRIPAAPLLTYVRTYRLICQNDCRKSIDDKLLSPAVPYIEDILVLDDEQVLVEACWVLYHLAYDARDNLGLYTDLLAARLVAVLGSAAAPSVQLAALAAVASMLYTTELVDMCLDAGCLYHIIKFLKCGNPSLVEYAAWGTCHLLCGEPHHVQLALDKDILDALVPALTGGNDTCKKDAVQAIRYFCARGSPSQLRELTASAALEPYCRLITEGDTICYDILEGLTHLLMRIEQYKPELVLRLREIGLPELLETVQQGENEYFRKKAGELLETHFHDDQ